MSDNKLKKIAIYSPYTKILGGGERYVLSIASLLSSDYTVTVFASSQIKKNAEKFLGIDLEKVNFISPDIFTSGKKLKKYQELKKYDLIFYITDGSIFYPFAKSNYLIIQSPGHIPPFNLSNKIKMHRWQIICYSEFVKKFISQRWSNKIHVLPPFIDPLIFKTTQIEKKNIILSVGRFFSHLHSKKHDVLIKVFQQYFKDYYQSWRLVIIGGTSDQDSQKYLQHLKSLVHQAPIEIYDNLSYARLTQYYRLAKIYWHAAGFGEDLAKNPQKAEHFGITTVEAMAAGVVPVVFHAGGQIEIIDKNKNGFFWKTEDKLAMATLKLMKDDNLRQKIAQAAVKRAKDYSPSIFYAKLKRIIE